MNLLRLVLWLIFFAGSAAYGNHSNAGETQPIYKPVFESANPHLRTASSYLRTGNVDFAALALEKFIRSWSDLQGDALRGLSLDKSQRDVSITTISKVLDDAQTALSMMDAGDPESARTILLAIRDHLWVMHRASGLDFFEDCIWETVRIGKALWHYRRIEPDLAVPKQADAVRKSGADYLEALNICDQRAPDNVKGDDRFRRLIDGARLSLQRFPEAVESQDGNLLFRLIIELRSIDRLLYFRFG